jgi:hypothetical protein
VILAAGLLLWPRPLHAQSRDAPAPSAAQQLAIARAFAPTLVFHPNEPYFPTSSMASDAIEGWQARVAEYEALSTKAKLDRAALAFRVFPRVEGASVEIIVEYWCYYVFNAYTIRGTWLPYSIADNHPHDLERLYLVLTPNAGAWRAEGPADDEWARTSFRISRIVANAHDGSIPPNVYEPRGRETPAPPVSILVERGAHAMAPDINRDGRYTPEIDGTAHAKALWGIRDNGSTWRGYRASFMDPRGESAIRLCGPAAEVDDADRACPRYALYPAGELQEWFQDLQLSARDREDMVGRTPWLVRTFGDMRVEELMAPTDAAGRAYDRILHRRKSTETGFVVGFTTVDHGPALVLSRRHFWEVPSARAPDLLVEGVALFTTGRTLFEGTMWATYKADAITNLMFGFGYFTERHTASPILGAEIRLGRFRVRPNWRPADNGFDTRITTTF